MQKVSKISRVEVLNYMEKDMLKAMDDYLKPIDTNWQPSDLLPKSEQEDFFDQVKELQEKAKNLSYDLVAVLIGDTITEEALPTYESWLLVLEHVNKDTNGGWSQWVRGWTAEENRHGDALNKYLYLSGRVNMRQMEISTQYLLADGFDIGTAFDPYRTFVYTSFQELATNLSHRRVAQFAKQSGDDLLARLCGHVAADEARHANAYESFVSRILEVDPNEMLVAFEDMMKKKIVMPAHFMREAGMGKGETYVHFSEAAQRLGVYTAFDYIDILNSLIDEWKIDALSGLNESGEKARDYIMALPSRLLRLAERMKPRVISDYKFSWIYQ
jgi:acyl-[acyl-carrier-protein] desaturase